MYGQIYAPRYTLRLLVFRYLALRRHLILFRTPPSGTYVPMDYRQSPGQWRRTPGYLFGLSFKGARALNIQDAPSRILDKLLEAKYKLPVKNSGVPNPPIHILSRGEILTHRVSA